MKPPQSHKAKAILSGLKDQITKPGTSDDEQFEAALKTGAALRSLLTSAQLEKAGG